MTPIPILSKPRLVKLAICRHCGQYPCRVGWVRIRNTGVQCCDVIWVYGLFIINVGLISVFDQNSFLLDFRVGDFSLMVAVLCGAFVTTSSRFVDINKN